MGWMFAEFARRVGHFPEVITGKPLALGGSLGRDAAYEISVARVAEAERARGYL